MKIQTTLLVDWYKICHKEFYDKRIQLLTSYYTPRMSRIKGWDTVPVLGIQSFIQEFLIDHFNENFFKRSLKDVVEEYNYIISEGLGEDEVNNEKIISLHKLGYLPLDIRSLDEGMECPIRCPMIEITNTHPDFAWVTNSIESLMSCELWYQMIAAKVGVEYRKIANKWFEKTCDGDWLTKARSAISEFAMRGEHCLEGAMRASTGFLCSFNKTSTVPAIARICNYYGDRFRDIATGMKSTEHSIACSSNTLDGDEITLLRRLITVEVPKGKLSFVSDSYDYWNFIINIVPQLKNEILNRDGTIFFRGDSGDPVKIITQTVVELWKIFGGTVNSKGYKVLDPHVRAIYGDSITMVRANRIYFELEELGFAAENVALGAGSFSMLCLEEEDGYICEGQGSAFELKYKLSPFTRDTFGVAIKTTYGETKDGGFDIFKNPKTDTGNFKKSQMGCCVVFNPEDHDDVLWYTQGYTLEEAHNDNGNLLTPVFLNGELVKKTTFAEIRNRLWNGNF